MESIALLVLLFLSAVFSGSETALITISMARVESLIKEERRGAKALFKLKSDTPQMLITILIGNNLVNIAAASIATLLATAWFGHFGPGIAVGILTIVILIFGEITPKSLATCYSERISLFIAPFILGLMRLLYPLVWLFGRFTLWITHYFNVTSEPTVTESELIRMLGHGEKEGTIEQGERELIERVFAFNDLTARDVMTPLHNVFELDGSQNVLEALPKVMAQPYSRIPVYAEQPDKIRGVLFLRSLLESSAKGEDDATLNDIAQEAAFVSQYQPVDELFATLRNEKRHMAVVVDEHGITRGIVTLEDLIEELVGEIYDESDITPTELTQISDGVIQVAGSAEMRLVAEYFDIEPPGKPTDTISFWVLSHTERIPKAGEIFSSDGLKVKVDKASKYRIDLVSLSRDESC
ncbi:MAG: hemolysin family protein [Arenicellales bacterium]